MDKFDFTEIELEQLITHHIGNKLRNEGCNLSMEVSKFSNDTKNILVKYFINSFRNNEIYKFNHAIDIEMNEVYCLTKKLHDTRNLMDFIDYSQNITKLLYEKSLHPKIKDGKLNITKFSNVMFNNESVDAIGIFKSETNIPFIRMNKFENRYDIEHEYGFDINGIDKGCIILKSNDDEAYKILVLDKTNKNDARYWTDEFLNICPINDDYFKTNEFLNITKHFITKELPQKFDISKVDQADLLNKSVQFFKDKNTFEMNEFVNEVIVQPEIIDSFNHYKNSYEHVQDVVITNKFSISDVAVKKQARALKSVIKLDNNFHIYVHGNSQYIKKGYDKETKMHFYQFFFKEEQ